MTSIALPCTLPCLQWKLVSLRAHLLSHAHSLCDTQHSAAEVYVPWKTGTSQRKRSLLDCKNGWVSFYLGPFFWIPVFLQSWAQGRGHRLHQTHPCGYTRSWTIVMTFESRWPHWAWIQGKADGWRCHHAQYPVLHSGGETMDPFKAVWRQQASGWIPFMFKQTMPWSLTPESLNSLDVE